MLTFDVVSEELDKIVQEFGQGYAPDDTCVYADDEGHPSCIVGHVLSRLDRETFKSVRNEWNYELISVLATNGTVALESQDLKRRLQLLQNMQDQGLTWGEAVKEGFHGTDI